MRSRLIQVGIQQFINYQLVPRARAQWLRKKGEHDHGRTERRDRLTAKDDGRGSRGPDIALAKGVSASTLVGEDAGRPAVPGDDDSVGARLTSRVDSTVGENGELVERPLLAPEIELLKVLVLVRIRIGADSVVILHHSARGIRGFGDGIAAVLGRAAGGRVIGSSDNGDQRQEGGEWQSHFVCAIGRGGGRVVCGLRRGEVGCEAAVGRCSGGVGVEYLSRWKRTDTRGSPTSQLHRVASSVWQNHIVVSEEENTAERA